MEKFDEKAFKVPFNNRVELWFEGEYNPSNLFLVESGDLSEVY